MDDFKTLIYRLDYCHDNILKAREYGHNYDRLEYFLSMADETLKQIAELLESM